MFGSQPRPAHRPTARPQTLRVEELDARVTPDAQAIDDVYTGIQGQVLNIGVAQGVLANDISPNNATPNLVVPQTNNVPITFFGTPPVAGTGFPRPPAGTLRLNGNGSFTVAIPSNLPEGVQGLQFTYAVQDNNDTASPPDAGLVRINIIRTGQTADLFATGSGVGVPAQVRVFDAKTGNERFTLFPYEATFTGGVRVATGDLTGDGLDDVVTVPETGSGGAPRVRVYDGKDGVPVADFFAFADDPNFRGGGDVAVGNVDSIGGNSIVVGAGNTGGPRVQVYRGQDVTALTPVINPVADFFAYETSFRNGVRVAAGNVRGFTANDQLRRDFIVTGSGVGGGPRVNVFDFATLRANRTNTPTPVSSFFAFDASNRNGVNVAVGQFRSDGRADIVAGQGQGGTNFRVFDGSTLSLLREKAVSGAESPTGQGSTSTGTGANVGFATTNLGVGTSGGSGSLIAVNNGITGGGGSGGVRVAVTDRNGDGLSDIITGLGSGSIPRVRIFDGNSLAEIDNFLAYPNTFNGGVFVGGNSLVQ